MRVCKQWYSLATPYLYEAIIIGRCKTLKTLCDVLQPLRSPENADAGNDHPLGWWSTRLDVAMCDGPTNIELESLLQIIHSLPNLKILVFRITISNYQYDFPDSFVHHLSRSPKPSLLAIVWYTRALMPNRYQWHAFLVNMPSLRTLSCVHIDRLSDDPLPALPALRTFCLPYSGSVLLNSTTRIRSLTLGAYNVDADWKKFLLNYGHQLEVVRVHVIWKSGVLHVLDTISQTCPKLRRLDIAIQSWGELSLAHDGLSLPATIRSFGLYRRPSQAPRASYKQLFSALRNMKVGPEFESIQFLNPSNVMDLCEHHRGLLLANLNELRFGMLDHEGRTLANLTGSLFVSI